MQNKMKVRRAVQLMGSVVVLASHVSHGAALIRLDSYGIVPWGISDDGTVAVGTIVGPSNDSFYWRAGAGIQRISPAQGAYGSYSTLRGVTADGTTAVGETDTSCCSRSAATWTQAGGWSPIPKSNGPADFSRDHAHAISGDGRVIVGFRQPGDYTPVFYAPLVWVNGALQTPGNLPRGSNPEGVSDDGTTIVGDYVTLDNTSAFVWTQSGGFVTIASASMNCYNTAWGVSADGTVAVGGTCPGANERAFQWTQANGLSYLDVPAGYTNSEAVAASGNGQVIVGSASGNGSVAMIWDASHGARLLQDVLTNDLQLDLGGWQLTDAHAVSRDGRFVAGTALNSTGQLVGFIADLTPIPLPDALGLLATALTLLVPFGRRFQPAKMR